MKQQKTLRNSVSLSGVSVHSGTPVTLVLHPERENFGLRFYRTDLTPHVEIPANINNVIDTRACTTIGIKSGITVSTVEHLMAALAGLEITNCRIEISGPEIPILDGCSSTFLTAIDDAGGTKSQDMPAQRIRIKKPVFSEHKDCWMKLSPGPDDELSYALTVDLKQREGLGSYSMSYQHTIDNFRQEISTARTYGFFADAKKLQEQGLALGSSLDNSLVFKDGKPMNSKGMRFTNEMVRHKILDAIGDFYLTGMPLEGRINGYNTNHDLNNKVIRKLMCDNDNYEIL